MIKGYTRSEKHPNKPYLAQISVNGRSQGLGSYKTAREARRAYREARKALSRTENKRVRLPKTPWKDEEKEELLRMYETSKFSYRKIGEALGRTETSVYHMLRKLRLGQ